MNLLLLEIGYLEKSFNKCKIILSLYYKVSFMKKILTLFVLIVTINAQENDILKSKYGSREFDGPTFDNNRTEKPVTKLPALLKSSIVNSNPEFISATSDSVYEDSTYLFNVLTNDPDPNSVTVSVASNPSWLTLTAKAGGGMSNITPYPFAANNQATQTPIDYTSGIAVDNSGNFYYSDELIHVIRKIGSDGKITDIAGSIGNFGYSGDGGAATSAKLNSPMDIAFDSNDNLYFADEGNHRIRKVDTNGIISTVAGTGDADYGGDGGAATSAKLNKPKGVAFDGSDNMYIADYSNNRIRKVDTSGNITTVAGTGGNMYSGDGGAATSAKLDEPVRVRVDSNGNLYIAVFGNHRIRKVDTNGIISTVAGTGVNEYGGDGGAATSAQIRHPRGIAFDASGNFYIADYWNHRIRKVDTNGIISTFAGTGEQGFSGDGGAAKSAKLLYPENIVFYNNSLYIADSGNDRIRKIENVNSSDSENRTITSIVGADIYNGDNILASTASLYLPRNLSFDRNGNLYIAEQKAHRIRKIDTSGKITTVAGNGTSGYSGDGGAAISAQINNPRGVLVDDAGNIYISDISNSRIRKVDTNGIITTFAGTGESGYSGDGGAATSAKIASPYQLTIDKNENIYFADYSNNVVRKIDTNGIITTFAGTGESGYSGDGGAATSAKLEWPLGVALDSEGNLYIADYTNNRIRKVDTSGNITTVAGTGTSGYSGDGGLATSATLDDPAGLAIDQSGNIYFCDTNNDVVRKIWKSGIITTIAGTGIRGYSAPSTGTSTTFYAPYGIVLDSLNNVYIADSWNYLIRKLDASYHTLTGTPTNSDVGTTTMTLTASDGQSGSATQSFTIKVINRNDAPVLSAISNVTTNEDTAKTVTLSATDVDGDALTYTGKSNTDKVTISISSTTMTLTPAADWYGTASITAYVSDGTVKDSTTFTLSVTAVNDAPVITAVANDSTNEETEKSIVLSASDIDADALTYTASSDTSAVAVTISTDTLKLTPALNYTGTSVITVIVSDNALADTTKFDFKVINVNDAPVIAAVANDTTSEDSDGKALKLSASDIDGDVLTYSAFSDTLGLTVTVSNDTVRLKPVADYFGTSKVTAVTNDGAINDSTTFSFTVLNVQDAPYAFDWVSTALDTIDITQDPANLAEVYKLEWTESIDVDGDTIDYLLYVKIGVLEPEEIYDTTSTSVPITYQEFLENVFEPFPMLPRVTVQFSMEATDGIDTVKITGDNRVLFVNRYEYLSTISEGIPTEFALHENYPNPFNPTTTLRFDLPELSDMTLIVYNMLGQKVRTFNIQSTPAGYHSVTWDATNDLGQQVGAGVYLYQLQAKDFVKTRKMVLLK